MNTIRPSGFAPTQAQAPANRPDAARLEAQRAFFQMATGQAAAAPRAAAASAAQAAPQPAAPARVQRLPEAGAAAPEKILRPGSLLDIRV